MQKACQHRVELKAKKIKDMSLELAQGLSKAIQKLSNA